MSSDRWKATIVLSCDHAGIGRYMQLLEHQLVRGLANIEEPRKVRDWLQFLVGASDHWCEANGVDMRGWMERYAKARR